MNLHVSHDNVFMDYVISISDEVDKDNNRFVILGYDESNMLKYIKSKNAALYKYDSLEFWNAIGDINTYKNIYIHWLEGLTVDFVLRLPKSVNIIWCFWGGDGLEIPSLRLRIYQEKTLEYFLKNQNRHESLIENLKSLYRKRRTTRKHLQAIRRVNYFAHYLSEDYELIRNDTGMTARFIPFHYASVEDIVSIKEEPGVKSNDIILGNSDTLSNNHLEAIDYLSALNLSDTRIYCPLSYEKKEYAQFIASYGAKALGRNFIPLLEFMPKADYDSLLSSVNVAIMNHNRSQALGNIMVLLWKGARIYMSKKSSIYNLLLEKGCKIFCLDDLREVDISSPLSKAEVEMNRKILLDLFSRENQKKKFQSLLSI